MESIMSSTVNSVRNNNPNDTYSKDNSKKNQNYEEVAKKVNDSDNNSKKVATKDVSTNDVNTKKEESATKGINTKFDKETFIAFNTSRVGKPIFGAKSKMNTTTYKRALDEFDNILANRFSFNFNTNTATKNATEVKPEAAVTRVVNVKDEEYSKISKGAEDVSSKNILKEKGIYNGKRYIVLDDTRYETDIPEAEKKRMYSNKWKASFYKFSR